MNLRSIAGKMKTLLAGIRLRGRSSRRRFAGLFFASVVFAGYWFSLPAKLFDDPNSTVLFSANGTLLSASIAGDGQWRFPQADSVPHKFIEAIVAFEDKRFFSHPGVDVLSMARAFARNVEARRIKSGGSTLTMQVIRLSRKNRPRTIFEKAWESVLATRLELSKSKQEIIALYAANAPFGGNIVGIEAACWRYFGTDPKDMSWAQAALLAVLPNSPSLIHPGRNRDTLLKKRNALLDKLTALGKIDPLTCDMAKAEPIPDAPRPLPRYARHLLQRIIGDDGSGAKVRSTIDFHLQEQTEAVLEQHHERLRGRQVYNGAVLVLDVATGNVLAYVGNVDGKGHENDVDIITARRSTGSILKPFLYAAMLNDGKMLPRTILPDVPVLMNGFAPRNFSHAYDGAVTADKALIRSLNVPAVHMLRDFNVEKFQTVLKRMGMSTIDQSPDHYGLSLILGGAEGTLWELTGMYASLARTMNTYFEFPGNNRYRDSDVRPPSYRSATNLSDDRTDNGVLSAASIYFTLNTLKEVYRPGEETGWRYFNSSRQIAWKTGTSFGFRDGWAIGVTSRYAVGVWIGNADGEGRPGLTGTETAAPVMFDVFSRLPAEVEWFGMPRTECAEVQVCMASGHRASELCPQKSSELVPLAGLKTKVCPYHQRVHLSADERFRVHDRCADVAEMKHRSWFVLPPVQEYYYRAVHSTYRVLPPFHEGCENTQAVADMDMLYPPNNAMLFIPRELDGERGSAVFRLAHRKPGATVYWHLDGKFIGTTTQTHHLPLNPGKGKHSITIVDDEGEELRRSFEVVVR